ncbi:MAG: hypothetical protein JRJ09_10035 [Deltaproteobacteria bacterium]|nr:hypothetical protein [Deltaproteobacteria bacterium]MBW2353587.1 hypothetical protein [Deltaproteobacteria bacterium]
MKRTELIHILKVFSGILFFCLGAFTVAVVDSGLDNAMAASPQEVEKVSGPLGIDVSDLTDVEALGFLSHGKVSPWGRLFADETDRIFVAEGDSVYVAFEKGYQVKPGDLFTVYKSSDQLDHPITGKDLGYVVYFMGRVVLKREVKPSLYKAKIVESYNPMQVGDPLIPFTWLSPCVRLAPPDWKKLKKLEGPELSVVASKALMEIMGQLSVVYMDHGLIHGIRRGNFFKIVARPEENLPKEPVLPDQALGYLLILEARPHTSTGIVVRANREFSSGAMLRAIHVVGEVKDALIHYGKTDWKETDLESDPLGVLKRLRTGARPEPELPESLHILATMPGCGAR